MARVRGTINDDFLFGTEADDQIFGLGGGDNLFGLGGNDIIYGGEGDDRLTGGAGSDSLTGGTGSDIFSWFVGSAADSTSLAQDRVTDFEGAGVAGGDTLLLSDFSSRPLVFQGVASRPALGSAIGFGGNGFTEVFYAFDGTSTLLFADSNDDGIFDANDFAVRISGRQNLTRGDFGTTAFVLRGTSDNDTIIGTDANDTIFGLAGNDILIGGAGDDKIDGGSGDDNLNGGVGNDALIGGAGTDILSGDFGRDNIRGDDGNDVIDGGADGDQLLGGNGNDLVFGGDGDDNMDGDAGVDLLFGGAGDDFLNGGDDADTVYGDAGDDYVEGLHGNDTLFGGVGNDIMVGDGGADVMSGGAGDDRFAYFPGGPFLDSSIAAADRVLDFQGAGVAGGDVVSFNQQRVVFRGEVSVNPVLGAALVGGGNGLTDMSYTVRNGTTWLIQDTNDDGRLDNADLAVAFNGTHKFTQGDFTLAKFITAGTNGADTMAGTAGDDILFGLAGNDKMFGGAGNDEMDGGLGNDTLDGGAGFNDLRGGDGNDILTLQTSDVGGNADGGAGDDLLIGSDVPFTFSALEGGAGNDTLRAGAGGASLSDTGGGNDRLVGGAGDDQFLGGEGVDTFVFGALWTSPATGFQDIIFDFEDDLEKIDLRGSGISFADLTIGDDGFSAIITSAAGRIEVSGLAGHITSNDFLF